MSAVEVPEEDSLTKSVCEWLEKGGYVLEMEVARVLASRDPAPGAGLSLQAHSVLKAQAPWKDAVKSASE